MSSQVINGVGKAGIRPATSSSSSVVVMDTDAQAFLTAAVITDTTQVNAVNELVLDLKAAGIWTKMKALYPMVGGTAASHKWNLKDSRDLDAAFRLVFNGGGTHSSTGYLPNGSNAYGDSKLIPSTSLSLNNTHISFYSRTNIGSALDIGAYVANPSPSRLYIGCRSVGNIMWFGNNSSTEVSTSNTDGSGLYVNTRISSTTMSLFRNSTKFSSNTNSNVLGARAIYIGGANAEGGNFYGTKQCAFASIGDGLTDLESNLFYQIVEKYQVALGRNINATQPFYFNRNYSNETNAFIFNGSITGTTQQSAVNTLVGDLKSSGLWTKMKAIYPMVGGTVLAHKFNLVNPVDTNAAYRLVFNGGGTHSSTGYQPNGSTAYADTYLIPRNVLSDINLHISYYSRTQSSINGADMGSAQSNNSNELSMYGYYSAVSLKGGTCYTYPSEGVTHNTTNTKGLQIITRTASNVLSLHWNGSKLSTNTSTKSQTTPNVSTLIGSNRNGATPLGFSNRECAFASIGDGLTDMESNLFYQIVEKFQNALGRNVNTTQPFYYSSGYTNETNAFIYNGGITDATQISAVNTLVSTLKTAGVWTKMKAVYPMVGGTALSHKFNLVNPIDSTSAYALTFNGGWTHTSTGVTVNTSNGYADTNLNTTLLSQNNTHLSYYSNTPGTSESYMGSVKLIVGNDYFWTSLRTVGNQFYPMVNCTSGSGSGINYSISNYNRLLISNRIDGNNQQGWVYNTKTTLSKTSSAVNGLNIWLGSINFSGSRFGTSNNNCAFASIGDGLTDAEATTFYNAVQAFQTTLNRQV